MKLAALAGPLRPLSMWSPIGLDEPQSLIDVHFESGGTQRDVTGRQVVLSLVPLVIGVGAADEAPAAAGQRAVLTFRDRARGELLGTLQLESTGRLGTNGTALDCYAVDASRHACLSAPMRAWQRLLQAQRGATPGFSMAARDVQHLLIFYICPRPVFLVSVADEAHENIFPMDLVGDIGGERFTLALRNTSPSIETLRKSRRAALADVSLQDCALAYSLGKHHNLSRIDWSTLPRETVRSPRHGLRVPAETPRIRDVDILDAHTPGSHTVFVCRMAGEERRADAARLFHTSGIHRAWRRRQGALPWRETAA